MDSRLHQILIPVAGGPAQPIRRFNDSAIQEHVDRALDDIEEESAILDVTLDPDSGLRWVLAAKLNGHWSIGHIGHFKGRSDWGLGARVKFKWGKKG